MFVPVIKSSVASAFLVRSAEIAPNGEYLTLLNRINAGSPAFCNVSLRASMISSFQTFFVCASFLGNKILFSPGSCLWACFCGAPCLLLVYFTSVQSFFFFDDCRVGFSFAT